MGIAESRHKNSFSLAIVVVECDTAKWKPKNRISVYYIRTLKKKTILNQWKDIIWILRYLTFIVLTNVFPILEPRAGTTKEWNKWSSHNRLGTLALWEMGTQSHLHRAVQVILNSVRARKRGLDSSHPEVRAIQFGLDLNLVKKAW